MVLIGLCLKQKSQRSAQENRHPQKRNHQRRKIPEPRNLLQVRRGDIVV